MKNLSIIFTVLISIIFMFSCSDSYSPLNDEEILENNGEGSLLETNNKDELEKESKSSPYIVFTSERLPFEINFLGEPKESITKEQTAVGEIEVVVYEYSPSAISSFSVTLTEYPAAFMELYTSEALLEETMNGALTQFKAKASNIENIEIEGREGLSFTLRGKYGGQDLLGTCNILIDKFTLIIIMYVNSQKWPDKDVLNDFFGSIKFKELSTDTIPDN